MLHRKDYGRRFPMRQIERDDLATWTSPAMPSTITEQPQWWTGDPPYGVSPYWHVLPPDAYPMTYTINTGTNTVEAA